MGTHIVSIEIERKFLVASDAWRQSADQGVRITQGYIVNANHCNVRVRIDGNGKCTVTTKMPHSGFTRYEFEHEVDQEVAQDLMDRCGDAIIDKVRHKITIDGLVWEIDAYRGLNEGLTVAEIELDSEDQVISQPDWLGEEVTSCPRYQNSMLAREPYRTWSEQTEPSAPVAVSDLV